MTWRWGSLQRSSAQGSSAAGKPSLLSRLGKKQTSAQVEQGDLVLAWGWQLKVDLGRQLKFPVTVAEFSLGSDIQYFLCQNHQGKWWCWSWLFPGWRRPLSGRGPSMRSCQANAKARDRGPGVPPSKWDVDDFPGQSPYSALKMLGVRRRRNNGAIRKISNATKKASRWLWIKRGNWWNTLATHTQVGTWSTPAGSPGRGCMKLKHPVTPGYITDDVSGGVWKTKQLTKLKRDHQNKLNKT